ncbi:hypothetical protein SAMN06269117_11361 [Balnearium lithotrophicum]|uniref:Uncharacterized protein n=1 Tax=Balnearium lithotrophicum TaxID=223788 RepID=A0A521CM13_9BACT|nr:hypothetical protein [Balnearium lithotrophicum]SMO59801.1 hypothetical protein SAMN06269117_11361 [Balnearium lithotrophicum]
MEKLKDVQIKVAPLTQEIKEAVKEIEIAYLRLARLLALAKEQQVYFQEGFEDFYDYAKSLTQREKRTIDMLLFLDRYIGEQGKVPIRQDLLSEIRYTKAYFLAVLVKEEVIKSEEEALPWIDRAKGMTTAEFKEAVNEELGKEVPETQSWKPLSSYRVPPEEKAAIDEAIELAASLEGIPKEELDAGKKGILLSRIVEDWKGYYADVVFQKNPEIGILRKRKEITEAQFPDIEVIYIKKESGEKLEP